MANGDRENPEVRQLREIRRELKNIESNTSARWWVIHGMLYGAGWILGSLLAVLIIGWGLSAIGVIPGLGAIAQAIQDAFSHIGHY